MKRRPAGQRGFALLIVLWTTSLLALIGTQVTAVGRTQTRIAANIRGAAIAEAAADAAVEEAAMRLMGPPGGQLATAGATYLVRLPQASVQVAVESEARLLPINTAGPPEIAALLRELGADKATAMQVALEISAWRTPMNIPGQTGGKAAEYRAAGLAYGPANQPFRDTADLALVLGMTPALYARLAPHISVYTQSPPKPGTGDPLVQAAIRDTGDGQPALTFDEAPVYRVVAVANAAGGGQFIRRATIRLTLGGQGVPDRAFDILDWRDGPREIPRD
jgi:general secretion pathway protein K